MKSFGQDKNYEWFDKNIGWKVGNEEKVFF